MFQAGKLMIQFLVSTYVICFGGIVCINQSIKTHYMYALKESGVRILALQIKYILFFWLEHGLYIQ